jgi:hypothetical protein
MHYDKFSISFQSLSKTPVTCASSITNSALPIRATGSRLNSHSISVQSEKLQEVPQPPRVAAGQRLMLAFSWHYSRRAAFYARHLRGSRGLTLCGGIGLADRAQIIEMFNLSLPA